ncbi:MAG: redoxin family protein, partial [Thermoplasmatota archaeon]
MRRWHNFILTFLVVTAFAITLLSGTGGSLEVDIEQEGILANPPEGYIHRPLLEFFTGLSCPSCMGSSPDADSPEKAVHDTYLKSMEDETVPHTTVVFHELNGGGRDDLQTQESEDRMRYYQPGLSGTPDVEIDGGYIELGGFSTSQKSIDEPNLDTALSNAGTRYENAPLRPLERLTWSFPYILLEIDQIYNEGEFYVEGKITYSGNAKMTIAPQLRGSLYVFMVEDNVTAYSKVYDKPEIENPYVSNDAVFRGYAIEDFRFTLNNRGEEVFSGSWSIPDAKVPIKPQDVYAVAAVFDTGDTSSSDGSDGNMKAQSMRCVQSATSRSTAYDRENLEPEVSSVNIQNNIITVGMDDPDGGIARAFVFYNTEASNASVWESVELTITGEELCDDTGACYAYAEPTGSATINYDEGVLYAQVLMYDDQMAQVSSEVYTLGEGDGSTSSKGGTVAISTTSLGLIVGISLIILAPIVFLVGTRGKGAMKRILGNKGALAVLLSIGLIITVFSAWGLVSSKTDKVPDFTVTDTEGNTLTPDTYSGKVLVIDIMSVDCEPCNEEMPDLVDIYKTVKAEYGDGVEFLSVSIDKRDTNDRLNGFQSEYGATWAIGRNPDFVTLFNALYTPTMIIVAPNGDLTYRYVGEVDPDRVIEEIGEAYREDYDTVSIRTSGSGLVVVGVIAAVFGAITFFSPCSFPMLPGFFTFYLASDSKREDGKKMNPLKGGIFAAGGIISFFLLIGIVVGLLGLIFDSVSTIQGFVMYLMPIVGTIMIVFGILMFLEKDAFLEKFVDAVKVPFRKITSRFRKEDAQESSGGGGLYAYGFGYGAAGGQVVEMNGIQGAGWQAQGDPKRQGAEHDGGGAEHQGARHQS